MSSTPGPRMERGSSCVGLGFRGCYVGGFGDADDGFAEISWREAVGDRGFLADSHEGFGDTFPTVLVDSCSKDVSKVVSAREVVLL